MKQNYPAILILSIFFLALVWALLNYPDVIEELRGNPPPGYIMLISNTGRHSYREPDGHRFFFDWRFRRQAVGQAWHGYRDDEEERKAGTVTWSEEKK